MSIAELIEGHEVSDKRKETLEIAIAAGADDKTLIALRDAARTHKGDSMVLPAHRLEGLSRGRGWARKGQGKSVTWGERVEGGYKVTAGRWTVGGSDGFSRKGTTVWDVNHVKVGEQLWTIAS